MTARERALLLSGLIIGAAVVTSLFVAPKYVVSRREPTASAADNEAANQSTTSPDMPANSAAAASIELSEQEQKAIGVETVEVKRQTIRKELVAPGKVAAPETGIGTISARISGRVEKLFVNVTGETVNQGQAVAIIYSPEILNVAEEYRLALDNRQRLTSSKEPQAVRDADELVRASRRRLELRGLTTQQIDEITTSEDQAVQVTTYSPLSGIITKRNVSEGQYVKEGDVLLEIADLGSVWVQADIFESDMPLIRVGQKVKITAPTLPGGSAQGTVNFLQPSVDPQNRTMAARIQASNPQMRLRPGMFVQVVFETAVGTNVVAVPRSAVMDTGREKVVYVAKDNGVFEKRTVDASLAGDDYYAVTHGIQVGDRVVTHGNFLIDSQTRLTGTITGMFGGSKAYGDSTSSQPAASGYTVTLQSEPAAPKGGSEGTFHVMVTGPDGKPVTDAQVRMTLVMPAMPTMGMGEMRSAVEFAWNGSEYVGKGMVAMAGPWTVTVEARRSGQLLGVYRSRFDAK